MSWHRCFTLDIVRTSTGEPVNSDDAGMELWNSKNYDRPYAFGGSEKMRSIAGTFSIRDKNNKKMAITPGDENFMVMEGKACVLKRPGHRNVYFTIPERPRPTVDSPLLGMDVIDFS